MASLFRIFSVIRKEFIQIVRDPRTLAITFVMPVMMLFVLGYASVTDVRNIPLGVLDQSQSPASRALVEAFRNTDYFTLAYDADSKVMPKLAKSWKADNPTTYVYEIRSDVKFSDGTPMTLEDVLFSLQ